MDIHGATKETQMKILENKTTKLQDDSVVLGIASNETQGIPFGADEPLGRNEVLGIASEETLGVPDGIEEPLGHWTIGIASEETQGFPFGADEPLGMNNQTGISAM